MILTKFGIAQLCVVWQVSLIEIIIVRLLQEITGLMVNILRLWLKFQILTVGMLISTWILCQPLSGLTPAMQQNTLTVSLTAIITISMLTLQEAIISEHLLIRVQLLKSVILTLLEHFQVYNMLAVLPDIIKD